MVSSISGIHPTTYGVSSAPTAVGSAPAAVQGDGIAALAARNPTGYDAGSAAGGGILSDVASGIKKSVTSWIDKASQGLDDLNKNVLPSILADGEKNGRLDPARVVAYQQQYGTYNSMLLLQKRAMDDERETMKRLVSHS